MPSRAPDAPAATGDVLRYASLTGGSALLVPCGADGLVDIDALSEHARTNYLLARALVGRHYGPPVHLRVRTAG